MKDLNHSQIMKTTSNNFSLPLNQTNPANLILLIITVMPAIIATQVYLKNQGMGSTVEAKMEMDMEA